MNVLCDAMFSLGKSDAANLRRRAPGLSPTELMAEEAKIPDFRADCDYSHWPVGAPVRASDQVWALLQPYDARSHPESPMVLRSHWSLCHSKDPKLAKRWVDALGISGRYMKGDCYKATDGTVYRALKDNLVYDAFSMPEAWQVVVEYPVP